MHSEHYSARNKEMILKESGAIENTVLELQVVRPRDLGRKMPTADLESNVEDHLK